jgi:hypothetical protein
MNTNDIIIEIDAQISRLLEAKALLAGPEITIERKPAQLSQVKLVGKATSSVRAKSAKSGAKRTISEEARARMAAAQKARWAKAKKVAKKSAVAKSASSKRVAAKKIVSAKKAVQKNQVDSAA